jgi:hypothetical protein
MDSFPRRTQLDVDGKLNEMSLLSCMKADEIVLYFTPSLTLANCSL